MKIYGIHVYTVELHQLFINLHVYKKNPDQDRHQNFKSNPDRHQKLALRTTVLGNDQLR
jgi:hypothetical protein